MADTDPTATARAIIDANLYMVLGTADEAGRPWVSPVYFAHSQYNQFFWVSRPETKHSRNLAERPEISIVIFDSQVPIGTGQGLYMSASAVELTGSERASAASRSSRSGRCSTVATAGRWRTWSRRHASASIGRPRRRTTSSTPTTSACR
jgi:uncharacterized protein YhbP (UPF0306 family)